MQSKSTLRLSALLLVTSLVFSNCQKGSVGPEGPEGPEGPPGTSNVIYSNWLDVKFKASTNTNFPAGTFEASIPAPKLTPTMLASGDMKVYINFGTAADPDVVPLPVADPFYGIFFTVDFLPQSIYLLASEDASTVTQGNQKSPLYRYILVPGGQQARRAAIDWNNYEEVKRTFNIPD